MKTRRKEKRWRKVATRKDEVVTLQLADALRLVEWHSRVRLIRAASLLICDTNLEERLKS